MSPLRNGVTQTRGSTRGLTRGLTGGSTRGSTRGFYAVALSHIPYYYLVSSLIQKIERYFGIFIAPDDSDKRKIKLSQMSATTLDYLTIMRETAENLGESTDRISLEPLALAKAEPCYRHQTIPLIGCGRIHYWDTGSLLQWLRTNPGNHWFNPLTRQGLSPDETKYVEHYEKCLEWEKKAFLKYPDEGQILEKFRDKNGKLQGDELLTARAILSPGNFADHFKDYPPIEGEIKYERLQAIQELMKAPRGAWLLRHSSLNRPQNPEHKKLYDNYGLRFYALSYKTDTTPIEIKHMLFLHRPGMGWAQVTGLKYNYNAIFPVNSTDYHVCFLDLLVSSVEQLNLQFKDCLTHYVDVLFQTV